MELQKVRQDFELEFDPHFMCVWGWREGSTEVIKKLQLWSLDEHFVAYCGLNRYAYLGLVIQGRDTGDYHQTGALSKITVVKPGFCQSTIHPETDRYKHCWSLKTWIVLWESCISTLSYKQATTLVWITESCSINTTERCNPLRSRVICFDTQLSKNSATPASAQNVKTPLFCKTNSPDYSKLRELGWKNPCVKLPSIQLQAIFSSGGKYVNWAS